MHVPEDYMTPEQRLWEIAGILATGILRLKSCPRAAGDLQKRTQTANKPQNSGK